MGSPTRCPEGLHYSEKEGICVWARDSGRTGCGVTPEEDRPKKRRREKTPEPDKPAENKKPKTLANGFTCPGGKLGVHLKLPHPTDCRSYYVCLNGVEASEAGCSVGLVFNSDSGTCDNPANVAGCETYYDKPSKSKKVETKIHLFVVKRDW